MYTGREIAIFSDVHSLYEPLKAVLEDIEKRGITEIYSLGDNIGVGPNPYEVMKLLSEYNVKSVAGNSEDYITLGSEPFYQYFNPLKEESRVWTKSKLDSKQIGEITLYPHSRDILLGNKKIALCHFSNDVRFDFIFNSTWSYQSNFPYGDAYRQFEYTNSDKQKDLIRSKIVNKDDRKMGGYLSAYKEPLFNGKSVFDYDAIIQGHVHFKLYENGNDTEFYTLRGLDMGFGKNDDIEKASYVILRERNDDKGFDLEEVYVPYDRNKMIASILNSNSPDKDTIRRFTGMR